MSVLSKYNKLTISATGDSFTAENKRRRKVGRRTPRHGGALQAGKNSSKITYYKFKNLDLK